MKSLFGSFFAGIAAGMVAAFAPVNQVQASSTSLTNGLVLWNTLGSDAEVSNSVYGPGLQKYVGGTWPDEPANTSYAPGEFGNAVGIGPGDYISESRVHNLVLNNLAQYLNPNRGTIDVWFLQNSTPTAYVNGAIRIFDGSYGLNSGMGFNSLPPPDNLAFGLTFGGTTTAVNYDITASNGTWLNLAGVWDTAGIEGSADQLRLYVNGQMVAATTNAAWGTTVGSQADIAGGEDNDCAGQFLVDNLKVYNRALTSNEVVEVYGGGEGFASQPPAIFSFSPVSATNGAVVAIVGTNFSAIAPSNIVYFGAVRANVLCASATGLTVTVPVGATYAPVTVTVNGLVASSSARFLPVYPGSGNFNASSLAARLDLPADVGPAHTLIADLDGDGKPDVIVLNGSLPSVSIFQNISANGSLTTNSFAPRFDLPLNASMSQGGDIALADLDGDGRLDIVVVSAATSKISILQNFCTPGVITSNSFGAQVDIPVNGGPGSLAVADVDGDGRQDIATANASSNTVSILLNVGAGGLITSNFFAPQVDFTTYPDARFVTLADLDGDGKPDLASVYYSDSSGVVSVLQNYSTPGNVAFGARLDFPCLPDCNSLRACDLDGDGRLDLVVAEGANAQAISVFRNASTPGTLTTNSFAARQDFAVGAWSHSLAFGDLDGDGKPDVAVSCELPSQLSIFINTSSPGNITFAPPLDFSTGWNAWGVEIGDLDGDGRPDLVFANQYDNTISLYQNVSPFGASTSPTNCTPPPASLAGWWPAEGNANDVIGGNNGTVIGALGYTNGLDGQAFVFDGSSSYISLPASPSLAIGSTGSGITIEAWILPNAFDVAVSGAPIMEWDSATTDGLQFWSGAELFANLQDTSGNGHVFFSATNLLSTNNWQHVALTYDQPSGAAVIYLNGSVVASNNFGSIIPQTTYPANIGRRTGQPIGLNDTYGGLMDELAIYNRALSAGEIQAIVAAGGAGKCTAPIAPVIAAQSGSETVLLNNAAQFSAIAYGTQPLSYQWSFNGTNLVGATNTVLTLNNVQPWQAGNYSVTVTNLAGAVTGSNAVLTVSIPQVPPTIVAQTPSQMVVLSSAATFAVTAAGTAPLNYQWSRNGAPIPNATNSSYTLFNAQLSDSGSWFGCLVTNAYGSASSTNATLKVLDIVANGLCSTAIVITNSPYTNYQSTLKADAPGNPTPDCVGGFGHGVWYVFTAPVNGQLVVDTFGSDFDTGLAVYTGTCDSLTEAACNDDTDGVTSQVILPTTAGVTYFILAGGYDSDAGNLVLHLQHLTAPAFVMQPADETVVAGSNATFSATVVGAFPLSFQWLFNGNPLSDSSHFAGSMTANLIISNVTTADAGGYSLSVSNFLGAANSATANLAVLVPPIFTQNPPSRSVPPGLPTVFSAAASGIPAPAYQWQMNGTNISGATFASYTNPAVGSNNLGWYQIVASNSVGAVTSAVAQLTFGPVAAWGRNTYGECLPPPGLSNVIGLAGNLTASFALRADGSVVGWGSGGMTNVSGAVSNVVALATSDSGEDYALRADGSVVGWPASILTGESNLTAIAAGYGFAYGLRAEGTVTNFAGRLLTPFPAGLNHVTAIACGYSSALALRTDGTVLAAGSGAATNVPAGLSNVVALAAGYSYGMALKSNGTVVAWGAGTATNLPAALTNIVAISAGNESENTGLAVRSNGTVIAWGDNIYGEQNPPAALSNLFTVAVSTPPYHELALINNGSPQILRPPVGLTAYTGRAVTLQAGAVGAPPLSYQWYVNGTNVPNATNSLLYFPSIQLANAGNYQLFVSNAYGTAWSLPAPVNVISNSSLYLLSQAASGITNYQASRVTLDNVTVLGSGPLTYQWFYAVSNAPPQGPPYAGFTPLTGATNDSLLLDPALASQSGAYYLAVSNQLNNVVRTTPQSVKIYFARAWGFQAVSNPPVNLTNAIAVATGGGDVAGLGNQTGAYLYLGLGSDGKVTPWANYLPTYGETNVSALSNSFVTAIAAGAANALALKSDGTVYAWGYGGYGQTNVPANLNNVVAISCGGYHDLALKSDGTVVGWGDSSPAPFYGQATNNPAATNVVAIAAGNEHSLALRADGSVVAWGYGGDGAIAIPVTATNVVAIAAGSSSSIALRANGTVVQWGSGILNYPPPPNLSSLSNLVAIAASGSHVSALKNDGTVLSWGYEYSGYASNSVPADVANVAQIAAGGNGDFALLGTRAPIFTVQPWNRTLIATSSIIPVTTITLAGKVVGVQPMSYQWWLNGTNVPSATNDTLSVRYDLPVSTLPPEGDYQLVASNAYGVTFSKPVKVLWAYSLGYALNAPSLPWTTFGNAPWYGQTNYTHDGLAAARSGSIGGSQESDLQMTLITNVPGSVTFWWKVSSEAYFDALQFLINGTAVTNISGEVNWTQASFPVTAGTNVLTWRYSKDPTYDSGLDAGFVDQFAFVPPPPSITSQTGSQIAHLGDTVIFSATASGAGPMTFIWFQTNAALPYVQNYLRTATYSGNNGVFTDSLVMNDVCRTNDGNYSVKVQNASGMTYGAGVTLKVLVPQVLATPTLLPNGSLQLISVDQGGGNGLSASDLANFQAQASTDLVNWITLTNALSLTNGSLLLQDQATTNYPTRYYRIIEQ